MKKLYDKIVNYLSTIEVDKYLHFNTELFITFIISFILISLGLSKLTSFLITLLIGIIIGVLKEIYDKSSNVPSLGNFGLS